MISRTLIKPHPARPWLTGLAIFGLLTATLLASGTALAVHNVGVFELDGNAIDNSSNATTTLPEDWDLICKANLSTNTPPGECIKNPTYTLPGGTTVSSPNSFNVDPSESSQDDILKGGTKDDNDVSTWKWASAKPSPPKNDITHGYAAEYVCNTTACGTQGLTGDKLLYFGSDRFSNSGSANIAFWFFQKRVTQKLADGVTDAGPTDTCADSGGCNFGGVHTAGNVSLGGSAPGACGPTPPAGSNCTPGDILIISAFGPKAAINIYEWVGYDANGDGNATSPCFTNECTLQPLLVGSAACSDQLPGGTDNACAEVNSAVTQSPWTVNQKNAAANSFQPTNFFEGGVNLTELNIDACFSSFLINTRASAAGDAELHDKILGQFARCAPDLTTAASTAGPVTPGSPVTDRATVQITGATNPDDPTGTVSFSICGPTATATTCTAANSTAVGSAVTLSNADCSPVSPNNTDGKRCAVSAQVNTAASPLAPGFYCFRATADLTNYDDPAEFSNNTTECFRVADTSTTATAQNWLPNDTATVTLGSGATATGSVTFTLYSNGTCTPGTNDVNVIHVFGPVTLDATGKASTNNTTFAISTTPGSTISWSVTYASGDANIGGSTSACESSVVTIDDDGP